MSRFTVTNLRERVKYYNELYPLPAPNGYGNLNRFKVSGAYGGFDVDILSPGSTGSSSVQGCRYSSAREAYSSLLAYVRSEYFARVIESEKH